MKKHEHREPEFTLPEITDPTLLVSKVTLRGIEYTLCFDGDSLAAAENELIRKDPSVNILAGLGSLNFANIRILFAASLRRFHPLIPFDHALKMVDIGNAMQVGNAVADAYNACLPKPSEATEDANPTVAGL